LATLRKAVASALSLTTLASSPEELARLKLVKSGLALVDDSSVSLLKEGGTQRLFFFKQPARRFSLIDIFLKN
jgi:hypothetical protein